MKKTALLVLLILGTHGFWAQSEFAKKRSIYLELGGSGGFGSLNYENLFLKKQKADLVWRLGLSIAPIDKNNGMGIVFPLMIHSLIGKNSHKLDLGLGQGITFSTKGKFFALTTAAIGYRYQSSTSKWFYRFTYTPLISYLVDFQIQQWAGISIGFTLNNKAK